MESSPNHREINDSFLHSFSESIKSFDNSPTKDILTSGSIIFVGGKEFIYNRKEQIFSLSHPVIINHSMGQFWNLWEAVLK